VTVVGQRRAAAQGFTRAEVRQLPGALADPLRAIEALYDWGGGFRSGVRGTLYSGIPADVAYLEAAIDPPRTGPFYRLDVRSEKRELQRLPLQRTARRSRDHP
jgi:hypothetical protein